MWPDNRICSPFYLASTILLFTSSSWAWGLVLQRKYRGTTHSQQRVQDVKCGRCNFLSCTKHDRFYPHCLLQAWQSASHTATLGWDRVICERDFSRIGLCVSLKIFSGQWVCWTGGLNSFLDSLSELMVNM